MTTRRKRAASPEMSFAEIVPLTLDDEELRELPTINPQEVTEVATDIEAPVETEVVEQEQVPAPEITRPAALPNKRPRKNTPKFSIIK